MEVMILLFLLGNIAMVAAMLSESANNLEKFLCGVVLTVEFGMVLWITVATNQ